MRLRALKKPAALKLLPLSRRYSERMRVSAAIAAFLAFGFLMAASLAAAEPEYHVLEKGETLYSLARKYQLPYEAIARANGIADPGKLKVGQKILIPNLHRVEKGETLFGIAKAYGVSVDAIRAANKLGASSVIKPGDVLYVPGGTKASGPAASASGAGTGAGASASAAGGAAAASGAAKSPAAEPKPPVSSSVVLPPPVKTSAKPVDAKLSWPCAGEARYLDGKLFGVLIRAKAGEPSVAVAGGSVVSAGPYRGFGQVAFVQSKAGYVYVYGGNESLSVGVGDRVKAGQELGRVGYDQKEGRPVAYFFVFKEGEALDPARAPRE